MCHRTLPLLIAAVLLLSACTAGRKDIQRENEAEKMEMTGNPLMCPVRRLCIWTPLKTSSTWRAVAFGV